MKAKEHRLRLAARNDDVEESDEPTADVTEPSDGSLDRYRIFGIKYWHLAPLGLVFGKLL